MVETKTVIKIIIYNSKTILVPVHLLTFFFILKITFYGIDCLMIFFYFHIFDYHFEGMNLFQKHIKYGCVRCIPGWGAMYMGYTELYRKIYTHFTNVLWLSVG